MTTTEHRTWFDTTARENFEKHLIDAQPSDCLQLGCFTGDATMWLLEHLSETRVVDVDTFGGSEEFSDEIDMEKVYKVYSERTEPFHDRLYTYMGATTETLYDLYRYGDTYDFIYIDADHHADAVLSDAVLAWPLLNKGGLMAFDDYRGGDPGPRTGASAFLMCHDDLEVVEHGVQLWVRKR